MTRRTIRALVALGASLTVLIAACGTRLDHDTIVRAAATGATTGAQSDTGVSLPGESGFGESGDIAAGGNAADLGDSGTAAGQGPADGTGTTGVTANQQGSNRAVAGSVGTASGAPIVIGSVGTYSGPVGVAYEDIPRALQAWAATINRKGGLNGRPVKVIVMDDGGDSSKARSHVKTLVEQHKAVAMVASHTTAQNMEAWLPYVEEKQFPVIGECGHAAHSSPMVFAPCPTLADAAFVTVSIGAQYGQGKKFGALFCTESDDCSYVEEHWFNKGQAKRAGLDPVYRAKISITQPDFTSECIQARNAGVELLSVIGDPNTVERVAASCQRQDYSPQFLQPDVTIDGDIPSQPGLEDVLAATRYFPFAGLSTPAFKEFEAAWAKYGDGEPTSGGAAFGWASSKMFEKVAQAAGNDISRDGLLTQLYGISHDRFGGLTVPLTFTRNGPQPASCMFLMQGKGGQWTAPKSDTPICP